MQRETMNDRAIKLVRNQRGWKNIVALRAAVEVSDVESLIEQKDERVIDAVLSMTGMGGKIRAVDTEVKKFIEKIIRAAAWDKRLYAVFGPTGVGKTFATKAVIGELKESLAYVRIHEYNRANKQSLLADVSRQFSIPNTNNKNGGYGHIWFNKVRDYFRDRNAALIIDEAQKLNDNTFEILRDLYDETKLSIVLLGSTAFQNRLATKKIGDEIFGQFLRRLDDRYELPHASAKDVRVFLSAYGINLEATESKTIAKRIRVWGDVDTLAKAMRIIAGNIDEGELSWSKVGAGQIMDAIERIIALMEIKEEADDTKDK